MCVPILLILRDPSLREGVARCLRAEGLEVSEAVASPEALTLARKARPALVVLDHLPIGKDAAPLDGNARGGSEPLLLLLGADASEAEIVGALEAGVDGYLRLPCSSAQILAHVRALLRRRGGRVRQRPRELRVGDLRIAFATRQVTLAGRRVHLAPKEFEILAILVERAGRVVTRADLIRDLWPGDQSVKPATLDVHIFSLRTKLEEDPARPRRILTVRAVGYRFVEDEQE